MDLRYATALRNASHAWAHHRTVDALTLQDLKQGPTPHQQATHVVTAPNPAQSAAMQPQLARYGKLGTRLNIFA